MTISSLAKYIADVNRMVVENVIIESPETDPTIISVRTTKRDSCRCGICGKKCIGFDQGNGKRHWRALDNGNGYKVFLESNSPRVWCKEHGAVTQMVRATDQNTPGALRIQLPGCPYIFQEEQYPTIFGLAGILSVP